MLTLHEFNWIQVLRELKRQVNKKIMRHLLSTINEYVLDNENVVVFTQ